MQYIRTDQLGAGAVVAKDVLDVSGQCLIRAGEELTQKHLRALKMWGTEAVAVAAVGQASPCDGEPIAPADRERAKAKAKQLFRYAPVTHPAMARLFDACVERHLTTEPTEAEHHAV